MRWVVKNRLWDEERGGRGGGWGMREEEGRGG